MSSETFLKKKGGYRTLKAYQVAEVIYDLTFYFTERFLSKRDRTVDQMVQAARSGKQNIAEGSKASMTSTESEIKLTNVALASLEELLLDYEDYLRVRHLEHWDEKHPRYLRLRSFCMSDDLGAKCAALFPKLDAEEMCNMAITLLHQVKLMLAKLIESQERMFVKNGGIREQMTRARLAYRDGQKRGGQGGSRT